MVLSTNSGSFPSNSHVSATFSILLRFGESWSPTNCERFNADGSLMGDSSSLIQSSFPQTQEQYERQQRATEEAAKVSNL